MPGRVETSRVAASRTAEPLSYTAALKAVFSVADKALKLDKPPKADLKLQGYDAYVGKNGVKAIEIYFDDKKDPRRVGRDRLPVENILVDEKKGQLYVPHWSGMLGPFPLPKGVTVRTLLDSPFPAARTQYQKTIAALSEKVVDGLGGAMRKGRVDFDFKNGNFVSPSGEKMKHTYIDDHTGRIPGGALMVGKKEFWVEMIPGVSGQCLGPFELPKGFTMKSLDKAEPRTPRRPAADDNDRGNGWLDRGGGGSSSGVPGRSILDRLGGRGGGWYGGGGGGSGGGGWGGGGGGGGGS